MEKHMRDELIEGYVELLQRYRWDWYGTFTFREEIHPEAATKVFKVWLYSLNRKIFGNRFYKRPQDGVMVALATEYQRRGVIHFHNLIGRVPPEIDRFKWMEYWNHLAGFARIHPYDPSGSIAGYVAKYVSKGGQIDFLCPFPTDEKLPLPEQLLLYLERQ